MIELAFKGSPQIDVVQVGSPSDGVQLRVVMISDERAGICCSFVLDGTTTAKLRDAIEELRGEVREKIAAFRENTATALHERAGEATDAA